MAVKNIKLLYFLQVDVESSNSLFLLSMQKSSINDNDNGDLLLYKTSSDKQ